MKKFGFTLLEILLSLGIFSLLIGIILSIYTKMQEAESKIINTQKMVQVAQDFSEKMFNWSLSCDSITWISNTEILIQCGNDTRIVKKNWSKITAGIQWTTAEWESDKTVSVNNLEFSKVFDVSNTEIANMIEMSITTSVPDWDYFTWLAIWTGWFTLTSSYYFDKVK